MIGFGKQIGNIIFLYGDMLDIAFLIVVVRADLRHALPGDHEKPPAI